MPDTLDPTTASPLLDESAEGLAYVLEESDYYSRNWAVSNSDVSTFLESPALFEGRRRGLWPRTETPAMRMGTLTHRCVLEGLEPIVCPECPKLAVGIHPAHVREIPPGVLSNGARRGNPWREWEAAQPITDVLLKPDEWMAWKHYRAAVESGKPFGTQEEVDAVMEMAASVMSHPVAGNWLEGLLEGDRTIQTEIPVEWEDLDAGMRRRAKLDAFHAGRRLIIDLKTGRNVSPAAWVGASWNLGYHRQAAFYLDAAEALQWEPLAFVFIAVQNSPPWTCAVYEPDVALLDLGRDQITEALRRMREAFEGKRLWVPNYAKEVLTFSAPRWAKYEGEYDYVDE